jgi:hypothetical protein
MGPITQYANANAITGRSGLYPSRHQSDQTDHDSGPIIRQANRRLRCVLMRIADNLACHCNYYRAQADVDEARGVDKRASRVKLPRFSRPPRLCCRRRTNATSMFQKPDSILEKLRAFITASDWIDHLLADRKPPWQLPTIRAVTKLGSSRTSCNSTHSAVEESVELATCYLQSWLA